MIATIDFETTGLKAGEDEVLQVSIIDENYNVLLNVYCRPNNKGSWEDAQAVHGITPLMVANELPLERYVPTVLDILSKADKVIAYNAAFEDSYLKAYGIEVSNTRRVLFGAEKKRQAINYLHWLPAYPHKLEKQKKKRAI